MDHMKKKFIEAEIIANEDDFIWGDFADLVAIEERPKTLDEMLNELEEDVNPRVESEDTYDCIAHNMSETDMDEIFMELDDDDNPSPEYEY